MYSIEMLAAADVVCLDKTGTITDGTMAVTHFEALDGITHDEAFKIMKYLEGAESSINNTSRALIEYFGTEECEVLDKIPFSSARKFTALDIAGVGCYALGAPGFVPCDISKSLEAKIKHHAKLGERVMVLARLDSLDGRGRAVAVVALSDRIRPNAAETIKNFQDAGVSIRIISGDHAETVSTIAKRVGVKNADKYLSCENIDDEKLVELCEDYAVFGRVTPEQKVLLISTLKKNGHTVAMTGDGVNDTLALKEANCAIAMADGSEVARKVSQIVLLDSDFARLPDVVKEGRRCINNVRQSAVLFLMKTVFTILLSIFTAVTVTGYPFEPSQFLLLELFVIGISSVLLAIEPNNKRIEGTFLRRVLIKSVPNALVMFVPVLILLVVNHEMFSISVESRNAVASIVVTLVGFVNLLALCRPFNKWRLGVCILVGSGIALVSGVNFLLSDILGLLPAGENLLFLLGVIGIAISLSLIMHMLVKHLESFVDGVVSRVEKRLNKNK
jgi:cation-transporting ATPase E